MDGAVDMDSTGGTDVWKDAGTGEGIGAVCGGCKADGVDGWCGVLDFCGGGYIGCSCVAEDDSYDEEE